MSILILIAALLILTACKGTDEKLESGAGSEASNTGSVPPSQTINLPETLSLAIASKDSLNPYTANTTLNISILPLIYDSLIKIDSDYKIAYELAESVNMNGAVCTVKLRGGRKFSDNSAVSADDVVYSLENAKKSGAYSSRLSGVRSIEKKGSLSVEITLGSPDILFPYNLDVPVVRKDTLSKAGAIGSGRFVLQTKDGASLLEYSKTRYKNPPEVKQINLVSPPDDNAVMTGVKTGIISFMYYDMSKGELSGIGANIKPVDQSNLVFLGVNYRNKYLSSPKVRQALSLGTDREALVSGSFSGHGKPTASPFNPKMDSGKYSTSISCDRAAAASLLDEAGYDKKNAQGYRMAGNDVLELELLVSKSVSSKVSAARELEGYYKQLGIRIKIKSVKFDEYKALINAGKFELYLGDVKLNNNCGLSPFINGSASKNIDFSSKLKTEYNKFLQGDGFSGFSGAFTEHTPFIPLLYKDALVVYSRGITFDLKPSVTDMLYNILDGS